MALTVDLADCNLVQGTVGTVVELLANNTIFEVEFSDYNGRMIMPVGLQLDQITLVKTFAYNDVKKDCCE